MYWIAPLSGVVEKVGVEGPGLARDVRHGLRDAILYDQAVRAVLVILCYNLLIRPNTIS